MKERLRFIARTSPPENARYEAEATRLYWQNFVLESTKDYALTKASEMDLTPHAPLQSGAARSSTLVAEMPSDRETEI